MRLRSGIELDSGKSAVAQDIAAAAQSATSPENFAVVVDQLGRQRRAEGVPGGRRLLVDRREGRHAEHVVGGSGVDRAAAVDQHAQGLDSEGEQVPRDRVRVERPEALRVRSGRAPRGGRPGSRSAAKACPARCVRRVGLSRGDDHQRPIVRVAMHQCERVLHRLPRDLESDQQRVAAGQLLVPLVHVLGRPGTDLDLVAPVDRDAVAELHLEDAGERRTAAAHALDQGRCRRPRRAGTGGSPRRTGRR